MSHSGRNEMRSPQRTFRVSSRPSIVQRFLLAAVVLCGGLVAYAVIARMLTLGLVAIIIMLIVFVTLLAGARRKQRRRRWAMGFFNWRRPIEDPQEGRSEESQPSTATTGQPDPVQKPGSLSAKTHSPSDHSSTFTQNPVLSASGVEAEPTRIVPRITAKAPTTPRFAESTGPATLAPKLPDPPVFSSTSAPGRAPWHLPMGAAPSGLAADAARLGDLEVRAASMVGAGHRCQEPAGPRQDAYALGRTPDGRYLIIAVADGVSESPRSDLGARVAVSAATRELGKMLASGGMPAIDVELLYKIIAGEMLGTGRNRGLADKDICSVLIVAVIPTIPRPDGTRLGWASWIGDVSLWIQNEDTLHRMTGMEKEGLDRNTLSAVLPFNLDRPERYSFNIPPSARVAIMTDGLSDSLSTIAGAAKFFVQQWAGAAPHPAAFLHSLCYDGPGQTDDRTAVVVWCGVDRLPGETVEIGPRA
jgi:Protein phosphatase 2C